MTAQDICTSHCDERPFGVFARIGSLGGKIEKLDLLVNLLVDFIQ